MKTYILTLAIAVLATATITNAQRLSISKNNWVNYPVAKAQNELTFSEMLPAKLFSKANVVTVRPARPTILANSLPEIPMAKKNCLLKHPSVVADAGSSPKKPGSKTMAIN